MNVLGRKLPFSSIYSSLAGLTLMKFFDNLLSDEVNKLQNCDVNYIIPQFVFKPLDFKKELTWNKLEIEGPLTLKEFLKLLSEKFPKFSVKLIFCKGLLIYENYVGDSETKEDMIDYVIS